MVPNGWESKTFASLIKSGDITQIQDGNHGNSHPKSSDFVPSGIPFIMARDLTNGSINFTNCSYIARKQADSLRIGFSFPGDILLSHKGTVGQVAIVPEVDDYIMLTPQVTYYRLPQSSKLHNLYLYQYFLSSGFQERLKYLSAQSTRSYIGITAQKELPITLPPLPEQRKIAKILSTWDKAITTTEKLIETSKQQKKALMQQLLTGKKRLVNPETGKVFEGDWEEVKLGDAVHIGRGFAFKSSQYASTGTKIVRVTNIASSGHIDLSDCVFVPKDIAGEYQKYALKSEDVLLVMVGATAGKLGFVTPEILPSLLNQNMWSLRTKDNCALHQSFLKQIAEQIVSRYMLTQQGSARGFFTQSTFELVKFSIPVVEEQQKIASVLTAAEKEIEVLEAKLSHFKQEKKALMQQLLTGKRRVKVDEMEVA